MIRHAARWAALWMLCLVPAACSGGVGKVTRIVVVTFDTTRADRLGCYGYDQPTTPHLDRLARQAVLFEHAESQVPTTLPSHSTMFTGLYPQDHGVRYNLMFRLGPEATTLAEVLSEHGFATAAVPATFIVGPRYGLNQGFATYVDPPRPDSESRKHADDITRPAEEGVDLALDWLGEHQGEQVFLWLHFYDPHHPYTPPFPYSVQYRDEPYDGEIAYADAQFGRFLDRLKDDPQWAETLLLVAGDHGEGLRDHQERYHSYLVYESTQRVPLMIRAPGISPARIEEPVTLADVMPTVLDLAGIDPPANLRGISLRPALEGGALPRRDIYFESLAGSLNYGWAELRGIRHGRWKLIDSPDPELFDVVEDPGETVNLASIEVERLEDLRAALGQVAEPLRAESIAEQAHDPVVDPATHELLMSLGYVGSVTGGGSAVGAVNPREVIDMATELLQAQRAVATQSWDYVLQLAEYVLHRDSTNKWAMSSSVLALIGLDRAREAQDAAAKMLELYPDAVQSYVMLARAYMAQDLPETAHRVLDKGRKAIPGSEPLTYLAVVSAFDAGVATVCTQEVPAAIAEFSDSPRMLVLKARCQANAGDLEEALRTIASAADLGFSQLEMLEEADAFKEVVALPGFKELIAARDAAKESRP